MSSQAKILKIHPYNLRFQNIIDACPEELLLMIFDFLDPESIMRLTLVNKRWYDIVTNNISTMKKLPLFISHEKMMKKNLVVENRMFYKVRFESKTNSFNTEMLSSLKKIGSNVRELEFRHFWVHDVDVFQNILRNFPKIEKMEFNNCHNYLTDQQSNVANVLKLEHLKELELEVSCGMILGFVEAQLKSLKLHVTSNYRESAEQQNELHIMKFLYTQKKLETLELTIQSTSFKLFAKNDNDKYQFKLKELLIVDLKDEISGFDEDNLKDFLLTQDSVEKLEISGTFSEDIYEIFLVKFENVKTLSICIFLFPRNLKKIKVNKNVTKLIIDGRDDDTDQYSQFLSIFPNLTDISFLHEIPFETLFCLPKLCNSLKSLSLYRMLPGNHRNVKFLALKEFHLELFDGRNYWSDLVISNPTIESLSFKDFSKWILCRSFKADKLIKVCELLPNLKRLIFDGDMAEKWILFQDMRKSIEQSLIF